MSTPASEVRPTKAAPLIEKVKLTDGREVEFAGKRKILKETLIDKEAGTITLRVDFRNGETRSYSINPDLFFDFAAHGATQKYGDETAGEDDLDDAILAMDDLHARLEKGEWNVARQSGGFAGTSVLLKALVEYSRREGETENDAVARVKTYLSTKTQAEKVALRNSSKLKPIVDRLESEKIAKNSKVDTDALLAQI